MKSVPIKNFNKSIPKRGSSTAIWLVQGVGPVVKLRRMAENTQQRKHMKIQSQRREASHCDAFRSCSRVSSGVKDEMGSEQEGWDRRTDRFNQQRT